MMKLTLVGGFYYYDKKRALSALFFWASGICLGKLLKTIYVLMQWESI